MNVRDVRLWRKSRGTIEVALEWLDDFGQIALATVVSTWGSAPVPIGGQLVVAPGLSFEGSVSGGCVEAEVITEAEDVMASDRPKLLEFGIAEETAWRAGLPCGGAIKIYVEPLRRERDGVYLEAVLSARLARTSLAVLTILTTGARHLFDTAKSCLQRSPHTRTRAKADSSRPPKARLSCTPLSHASDSSSSARHISVRC